MVTQDEKSEAPSGADTEQVQDSSNTGRDRKKTLAVAGVILVLVAGLAALGWRVFDSNAALSDKDGEIADLQNQIDALKSAEGEPVESAEEEPEAPAEPAVSCSGGSSYSASVGQFDLTLSDPNVIIRTLDGGFEGGPITSLEIGQCVEGETNVVDTTPTGEVKITGHPSSSSADLRAAFESRWGSPLTAGSTLTIDGVSAQIYTGEGLFSTKVLYFDNAGIGYEIELADSNSVSEAILTDITDDWSFTP